MLKRCNSERFSSLVVFDIVKNIEVVYKGSLSILDGLFNKKSWENEEIILWPLRYFDLKPRKRTVANYNKRKGAWISKLFASTFDFFVFEKDDILNRISNFIFIFNFGLHHPEASTQRHFTSTNLGKVISK